MSINSSCRIRKFIICAVNVFFLILLFVSAVFASEYNQSSGIFSWKPLPDLPENIGVAGPFAGVSNGNGWPIPYAVEMGAIYASPVVLVACLCWAVLKGDRKELNIAHWALWTTAFLLAAGIAAWTYALSQLP